jgi:hypothetical protein
VLWGFINCFFSSSAAVFDLARNIGFEGIVLELNRTEDFTTAFAGAFPAGAGAFDEIADRMLTFEFNCGTELDEDFDENISLI